jgi:Cellulase (glycosyl hydrolase family 5)
MAMPTYPLNKNNAWKAWARGDVKGFNAYLSQAFPDRPLITQDTRTNQMVSIVLQERTLANQAMTMGMNAVRLWLSGWTMHFSLEAQDWNNAAEAGWDSDTPLVAAYGQSEKTLADVAKLITGLMDQCEKLGLGVILTGAYPDHYHAAQPRSVWAEPGSFAREHLGMFWAAVIKKWGRHKALIGLDILNEPAPPLPSAGLSHGDWRRDPKGWGTLAQDVVTKIRAAEAQSGLSTPIPIIVETIGAAHTIRMFDGYTPGVGGEIIRDPADRIVYSIHHYDPWHVTHQGIAGDNWVDLGRVYGKTVARDVEGGYDKPYDWYRSPGPGWGRHKILVKDEASLEANWQDLINFQQYAADEGKTIALFVGEFAHVQPVLSHVEPMDPNREYLIDPENGVPSFRVAEASEGFVHPVFSTKHITGGWKKQNPSRWVTRLEPFTDGGVAKIRLYFDNLDPLLFGRTWFGGITDKELGSLAAHVVSRDANGQIFVVPPTPTPRPDVVLNLICARDPVTGAVLKDTVDRNKLPLKALNAVGFPISTKLAEPGDDNPAENALEWPMEKFSNTLFMKLIGEEGVIIEKALVTIRLNEFWVEVDAAAMQYPRFRQAIGLDPFRTSEGFFPAQAVAVFASATPYEEMEAGRDQFVADTLAICRKHRISWAYLDAGISTIGPIGWRASARTMRRLKDECER